jgi:hypothetical protein
MVNNGPTILSFVASVLTKYYERTGWVLSRKTQEKLFNNALVTLGDKPGVFSQLSFLFCNRSRDRLLRRSVCSNKVENNG